MGGKWGDRFETVVRLMDALKSIWLGSSRNITNALHEDTQQLGAGGNLAEGSMDSQYAPTLAWHDYPQTAFILLTLNSKGGKRGCHYQLLSFP